MVHVHYIVMDLEWNQAMSSKSSVFNKLPIRLRGEIIEIGAVKLNADMTPAEEFQIDVKPVYFKRMHHKVKKLTGFDRERLAKGADFPDALRQFREWCGDDVTFLTWGCDDQGILEQNIIIHDLDWDWIAGWVNLQVIYNMQTDGDRNQKSLATAMEHFQIEQTRIAHDALGDAYNTALVCSHLNLEQGLEQYNAAARQLSTHSSTEHANGPEPIEHVASEPYPTKAEAFGDEHFVHPPCPHCDADMEYAKWVNQGDQRYMALAHCPEHGSMLVRLKLHKSELNEWTATRLIYQATESMESYYKQKAAQPRKRSRGRSRRKSKSNTAAQSGTA